MFKQITFFPSLRRDENDQALAGLDRLRDEKKISVKIVGGVGILDDCVDLPSILTDEGDRADGIIAVKRFIEHHLK